VTVKLVIANLKHKPMRSLLSILLIGVPVTLILCIVGLSHGMLEDSQRRTRGVGADIVVRPKNSSFLSLSGAPILQDMVSYMAQQPHVKLATGVINVPIEGITLGATGVDLGAFDQMSGGFRFVEGHAFEKPNEVIIDTFYNSQHHKHAGDSINLLSHEWRISGIFEGGKLAHVVFPLSVLQEHSGNTGKVSQIYLKLDDPANTDSAVKYLKSIPALEDWPIYTTEELTSLLNVNNIPALREFLLVIMSIAVIIGFAVVCLSMYMAVLQRTREIGILKSLGASKGFILEIILAEAVLLGVGGTVLGIVMSYGAYWLIQNLVPASFPMVIVQSWWWRAGAITLVGAILGALYPGLSAARHDPIEALAYE
jgi:putative ABC transport system permease protein